MFTCVLIFVPSPLGLKANMLILQCFLYQNTGIGLANKAYMKKLQKLILSKYFEDLSVKILIIFITDIISLQFYQLMILTRFYDFH